MTQKVLLNLNLRLEDRTDLPPAIQCPHHPARSILERYLRHPAHGYRNRLARIGRQRGPPWRAVTRLPIWRQPERVWSIPVLVQWQEGLSWAYTIWPL